MAYVPSAPNTAMRGSRALEKLFEKAFEKVKGKITDKIRLVWIETVVDIIDNSPNYTGASSGNPNGPFRHRLNYPSHPAYGMTIGNSFDGRDEVSGWSVKENKINQHKTQFYVTNSMWNHYLKFVEKAVWPSSTGGHFVKNAMNKLRERLRRGDI